MVSLGFAVLPRCSHVVKAALPRDRIGLLHDILALVPFTERALLSHLIIVLVVNVALVTIQLYRPFAECDRTGCRTLFSRCAFRHRHRAMPAHRRCCSPIWTRTHQWLR